MKKLYSQFDYNLSLVFAVFNDYRYLTEYDLTDLEDEKFDSLVDFISDKVDSFGDVYNFETDIYDYRDFIDEFLGQF